MEIILDTRVSHFGNARLLVLNASENGNGDFRNEARSSAEREAKFELAPRNGRRPADRDGAADRN
jgi:hypothetical protein